ncbi:MAG TPA: hypothetical protein PK821_04500 [Victivallales bacterium]|nr:hypothetical protein [Victivallales bacterium]
MSLTIDCQVQPGARKRMTRRKGMMNLENIYLAIRIAIPITIIFCIYSLAAFFNNNTNSMAKSKERLVSEIKNIEMEIENVKLRVEEKKGRNIYSQIEKFKLDLKLPKWGQYMKVNNIANAKTAAKPKKNVAQKRRISGI